MLGNYPARDVTCQTMNIQERFIVRQMMAHIVRHRDADRLADSPGPHSTDDARGDGLKVLRWAMGMMLTDVSMHRLAFELNRL